MGIHESGVLVLPPDDVHDVAREALRRQETGRLREEQIKHGALLGELSGASAKVGINA